MSQDQLKGVKHSANSGSLQYSHNQNIIFESFCYYFGVTVAKMFNQYKEISTEKVFGNLVFVLQPEFQEKGGG